jgi:hypothetical protein
MQAGRADWGGTHDERELALRGGPQVVAAGLVVAAHAWFLWYLQAEYEALPDKSDLASVTDYVDLWVPIFLLSMFAEAGTVLHFLFLILFFLLYQIPIFNQKQIYSISL